MDSETKTNLSENTSMDRFLQRMRTDLMYELRSIQHGERPVTGQNHREQLQQFMEKHMGTSEIPAPAADKGNNIPANVDSVEKHRPEAIVVEVQAIVELQPVSSVLRSVAFRRQLENVIRGTLTSSQSVRNSIGNRPRIFRPTAPSEISSVVSTGSSQVTPSSEAIHQTDNRPQLSRQDSSDSFESFSSARSSQEQDIDNEEDEERLAFPENMADSVSSVPGHSVSSVPEHPVSSEPENPVPAPRSQRQQIVVGEQNELSQERNLWNNITSLQREQIVEEISELLHSRLVSSTLEGDFRTALELMAERRLAASGTNGREVQNFINSLPQSGVLRNDFSQLGIPPVNDHDNWDNISVTSVSAHSVPYKQTNTYLGREIQSLKSQMKEMNHMLKLTFDLQMDLQRAVRQEVAAAMNNISVPGATGVTTPIFRPPGPVSDTHCLICLERHTDTVLYQCGHMCVCFVCGRDLLSRGHKCPVCRAPIKDVIRTYKTNAE